MPTYSRLADNESLWTVHCFWGLVSGRTTKEWVLPTVDAAQHKLITGEHRLKVKVLTQPHSTDFMKTVEILISGVKLGFFSWSDCTNLICLKLHMYALGVVDLNRYKATWKVKLN